MIDYPNQGGVTCLGISGDGECERHSNLKQKEPIRMKKIDNYPDMEALYDRLTDSNPDVIQQMTELIDAYVESRDEVYSNRAGRSILPKCESFRRLCGDNAAPVFGILMKRHLTAADWVMDGGSDGSKIRKIYLRN